MTLDSKPLNLSTEEKLSAELVEKEPGNDLAIAPPTESKELSSPPTNSPEDDCSQWTIFASTFATILLAEIGDKPQVTTLLMTAQSHSPWIVFAGAGSALVLTSLLGVLLGQWLAQRISPKTLEIAAGASLLVIATTLFWEIFH